MAWPLIVGAGARAAAPFAWRALLFVGGALGIVWVTEKLRGPPAEGSALKEIPEGIKWSLIIAGVGVLLWGASKMRIK